LRYEQQREDYQREQRYLDDLCYERQREDDLREQNYLTDLRCQPRHYDGLRLSLQHSDYQLEQKDDALFKLLTTSTISPFVIMFICLTLLIVVPLLFLFVI